ncbi:hypothetical protein RND71_031137 [Anisodus tanguticus]|uniref:Myb/SANT-like domain-containing protein n=1 Tax=Anisodus tanguticus TaxID=243964 RepID=A0AAE1UYL9_9SOLA|nr:hypothetical protein RND71_031137 [Anisodus tanguticus]
MSTLSSTLLQMDLPGPRVYGPMTQDQQYELLKLLAEVIRKDYAWGSTFREESWKFVGDQMHLSVARLKAKLRNLKRKYRLFSTLLARRGVQWDRRNNTVAFDREGVWISYVMENPQGYQFHDNGIQPRIFDAMCDVFEMGVSIDG